jgi:hypothetical protein
MNCPLEMAKPLSYWLVACGCILALASSLAPEPTGAYHLSAAFLMTGLVPYIVYGSLTDILQGCSLAAAGLILLATDLLARFVFNITNTGESGVITAIWLCTLLVLLVLPMGAALGRLLVRMLP